MLNTKPLPRHKGLTAEQIEKEELLESLVTVSLATRLKAAYTGSELIHSILVDDPDASVRLIVAIKGRKNVCEILSVDNDALVAGMAKVSLEAYADEGFIAEHGEEFRRFG